MRFLGCIQALGLIVIKWGQAQAYMDTGVTRGGNKCHTLSLSLSLDPDGISYRRRQNQTTICQPVADIKLVHSTLLGSIWARNLLPIHPCENVSYNGVELP